MLRDPIVTVPLLICAKCSKIQISVQFHCDLTFVPILFFDGRPTSLARTRTMPSTRVSIEPRFAGAPATDSGHPLAFHISNSHGRSLD